MAEIDKSNEIEKPEKPANVGEKVTITNPIEVPVVYYSNQPGAGPDDAPEEDEEEGKPKKKAVAGPPSNKALAKPEGNK